MDSIISEYIDPATGGDYAPVVVTTPEALPVDYTVATGLTDLQAAMANSNWPIRARPTSSRDIRRAR